MRPGQPGVDALGQRRVDLVGDIPQPRRVGVDQIDELGSHQRRPPGQVQVVADQHRLSHREIGAQAARRVGQHHRVHAGRACRANRVHDVAQVVSLVGVDPADEHQHAMLRDAHRQQLAAVPGGARWREARQFGHRHHRHRSAEFVDGRGPSRPEHHGDVVLADTRPLADGGRRLGSHRLRIGHTAGA